MTDNITLSTKRHIERCAICGKWIADNDLGLTAHRLTNLMYSDWAHDKCIKKQRIEQIKKRVLRDNPIDGVLEYAANSSVEY